MAKFKKYDTGCDLCEDLKVKYGREMALFNFTCPSCQRKWRLFEGEWSLVIKAELLQMMGKINMLPVGRRKQ
ncbi:MAG: hypothetical protein ABIG60_05795 [Patescibacteria group bacterium]